MKTRNPNPRRIKPRRRQLAGECVVTVTENGIATVVERRKVYYK